MTYTINFAGDDTIATATNYHNARTIAMSLLMAQGYRDDEIQVDPIGDVGHSIHGWKDTGSAGLMVMIYKTGDVA
jgi:methionine salvage enolase-phosphatase E1